jgi:hypothetical protein
MNGSGRALPPESPAVSTEMSTLWPRYSPHGCPQILTFHVDRTVRALCPQIEKRPIAIWVEAKVFVRTLGNFGSASDGFEDRFGPDNSAFWPPSYTSCE